MTLPHEMTLIEITQPGGPDVLQPRRVAVPVAGPGEILIRVQAAGSIARTPCNAPASTR